MNGRTQGRIVTLTSLAALAAVLVLFVCGGRCWGVPAEPEGLKDGVYRGSGIGYVDRIVVEVTVSGGRISALKILEDVEDVEYMDRAITLLDKVIEAQNTKIDAVSGATSSSQGILKAIDKALARARLPEGHKGKPEERKEKARLDGVGVVAALSRMKLLLSLLIGLLMVLCLEKAIKRHPRSFYFGALLLAVFSVCYYALKWDSFFPDWVSKLILDPVIRGSFPTALFILVMYAGALPLRFPIVQKLMRLRAELSIFACIVTLGHNVTYGSVYFRAMAIGFRDVSIQHAVATLITVLLLMIMLPLFVTSFPSVRRRIQPMRWKRLQRWAYLFYGGIYLHVASLYIFDLKRKSIEFASYTLVWGLYAILRIGKALKSRRKKQKGESPS